MQPNYYAIIPAEVRYDKTLPYGARLLFGEITALANKEGFCYAGNAYLAELFDIDKDTISGWISRLKKAGHINPVVNPTTGERRIYVAQPLRQNAEPPTTNTVGVYDENSRGLRQKSETPTTKDRHNNTVNTTSNKTQESAPESVSETAPPTKPPKPRKPKQTHSPSHELTFPPFAGEKFHLAWAQLCQTKKWRGKSPDALQMSLNKLAQYDEPFAVGLMNAAVENDWQGVVYDNTAERWAQHQVDARKVKPLHGQSAANHVTYQDLLKPEAKAHAETSTPRFSWKQ